MYEFKIEYVRDDGGVANIFISAFSEQGARETFVEETGYDEAVILSCE